MRPRFSPAIADSAACSTAGLSLWTHRVGVTGRACGRARRSPVASSVVIGELSPWRSVLPPLCVEGDAFDAGGGERVAYVSHPLNGIMSPLPIPRWPDR